MKRRFRQVQRRLDKRSSRRRVRLLPYDVRDVYPGQSGVDDAFALLVLPTLSTVSMVEECGPTGGCATDAEMAEDGRGGRELECEEVTP